MFVAPRLRTLESGERTRRATWLELFFDLVYVAVVASLARGLVGDLSPMGILRFAALFVPVWWSWVGFTLYNDRFDTDDVAQRILSFVAMLGAAALAVSARGAFEGSAFALAYVFLRALLVVQYVRVLRHVPLARPLGLHYAVGFGFAAALWLASLALAPPWRFALWVAAMVVDVGTPLSARRHQAKLPVSTSHLPERVGLFTIIVLGEAVAAVVRGIQTPRPVALVGGALGLSIAFGLWWVYFETADEHVVRRTRFAGLAWFYAHLPLAMGMTFAAVGVESLVRLGGAAALDPASRWVLGGGVALCFLSLGAIHLATIEREGAPQQGKRALVRFASAAVALGLTAFSGGLPAQAFAAALAILGVAQVALDPRRKTHEVAS